MSFQLQEAPQDGASMEGKFGWTTFDMKSVPYLIRHTKKYVSLYITHQQVFRVYTRIFTFEIFNCFDIVLHKMTEFEARLLNEINFTHCSNCFGYFTFTSESELITLEEARKIYDFLNFCYKLLILKNLSARAVAGFLQINTKHFIPYVSISNKQFVPVFYLSGQISYLEGKSIGLNGWPLYYLKLCCKIHGVENSYFDKNSVAVVDLDLLKEFFVPGTSFDYLWPANIEIKCLLKEKVYDLTNTVTGNTLKIGCLQTKRKKQSPYIIKNKAHTWEN